MLTSFKSVALAVVACALTVSAGAADQPPGSLRANVENVEDVRGGLNPGCRVVLTFFGEDLDDVAGVLRVLPHKAIDDQDREVSPAGGPGTGVAPWRFARVGGTRVPLRGVVALRNPSRRSAVLKSVEGSVELFRPTEANGGQVTIAAPLASPGLPLKSDVLERHAIVIMPINEERAAELRRTVNPRPGADDEQRRLAAVSQEVARRRAEREQVAAGASSPSALPASSANFNVSATVSERNAELRRVSFHVIDPNRKLVGLEWRGTDGAMLNVIGPVAFGEVRTFTFTGQPPANAHLIAYVATDGAVETRPFRVENVALP